MEKIAVIGTTTWGTTLAIHIAKKGIPVSLLTRTKEETSDLVRANENTRFLAGIPFPNSLEITDSQVKALKNGTILVIAVPSQSFRTNVLQIKRHLNDSYIILSATKGLEKTSALRMSQIVEETLPPSISEATCVLSGPNLAKEVIFEKPSVSVVASKSARSARRIQHILTSDAFRIYTSSDVIGVEMGGALKNIIALGSGICDGFGFGENTKAAFITRGLAEITRLGVALGANPRTFAGLAGLGDLIATSTSTLSRNRYVGQQLARGIKLSDILTGMDNVAEGVHTTTEALTLARELGVDMPIAAATARILFEDISPRLAITELLQRPARTEL
jgi:glycerol-3-phosphate dehydrogenase (NAD(P)+)